MDIARQLSVIASSERIGPRMKLAVALATSGLSLRRSAALVGFRDHNELARLLKRHGLGEAHRLRQAEVRRGQPFLWELDVRERLRESRAAGPYIPDPATERYVRMVDRWFRTLDRLESRRESRALGSRASV